MQGALQAFPGGGRGNGCLGCHLLGGSSEGNGCFDYQLLGGGDSDGGSAATASHYALGFAKQSAVAGKPRLKARSLADNVGLITAWGNDADYSAVFLEQLKDQLEPGDVVIGISISGNSPNVLRAVEYARGEGAMTIALTGFGGGELKQLADECITLTSRDYGQVEDAHLTLTCILSDILKKKIADG